MRAAGFYQIRICLLQLPECPDQLLCRRDQSLFEPDHGGNVHGRRIRIVGGLAHVYIVIWMQQLLTGDFISPVGDDFIGIHIGLSAGARLPDYQRKMVIQRAGYHLITGSLDRAALLFRHFIRLQFKIGLCSRFLHKPKRMRDLPGHRFNPRTYPEVHAAPLCLGTPVPVRRHLHLTHRIMFYPVFHSFFPPCKHFSLQTIYTAITVCCFCDGSIDIY